MHKLEGFLLWREEEPSFSLCVGKMLSLDDFESRVRKTSNIKQTLFDLRVAISHLMEQTKKEPTPQVIGMPMMGFKGFV